MSGSSKAVRVPPSVEISFDLGKSARAQVKEAVDSYREGYAWFAALGSSEYEQLIDSLVIHCAEAIGPDDQSPVLISIDMEELQKICETMVPLAELNAMLLDGLDLPHIFGANEETRRQNTYSQLVAARYDRTPAIAAADPQGKKFMVDAVPILSPRRPFTGDLQFTALGCHGTLTSAFSRAEASFFSSAGFSQYTSIMARKVVGKQNTVGTEVKAWHVAKQRAGVSTFGFLLGDNFYESGVPDTNIPVVDGMFNDGYYKVYNEVSGGVFSKTATPLNIPYFGLLGNHDYNFHGHAVVASDGSKLAQNMDRAIAEVDYTYRHPNRHWHMPHRYYLVTTPQADFYCIDTATLLFDKTQQAWLKNLFAERSGNGKWRFLMGHHGYVTFGKRGSGSKAEKDLAGLVKTAHTKASAKALADKGMTSATEEQMAGSASLGLKGNINKHVFTWCVREQLHFHFNVVAHDHFSAAALLTYDFPDGTYRRTYYVLAGGGGAYVGGASLETLVALGPNCANVDLLEKKYGFATFKVSSTTVELNYRLLDGSTWEDAWEAPKKFSLAARDYWTVNNGGGPLGPALKRVANPVLRGVFLKRGASGVLNNSAFQRRYFEIEWGSSTFRYGQKPGKLKDTIDLATADLASRSWLGGAITNQTISFGGGKLGQKFKGNKKGTQDGMWILSFDIPGRTHEFAVPAELYNDMIAWLDRGMGVASESQGGKATRVLGR